MDKQSTKVLTAELTEPPNFKTLVEDHVFANIGDIAFGLAGIAILMMFIYGGFMYMISGNNPQNKAKAQAILFWTLIGAVVIFGSVLVVLLIGEVLNLQIDTPLNEIVVPDN